MTAVAQQRMPAAGDSPTPRATRSTFRPRTSDAATIAFGMRNLPDYLARVRGDGALPAAGGQGRVPWRSPWPRSRLARFMLVVRPDRPGHGRLAGQARPTATSSGASRPTRRPERIAEIGEAGLVHVTWQGLTGGILVTLHEGTVRVAEGAAAYRRHPQGCPGLGTAPTPAADRTNTAPDLCVLQRRSDDRASRVTERPLPARSHRELVPHQPRFHLPGHLDDRVRSRDRPRLPFSASANPC